MKERKKKTFFLCNEEIEPFEMGMGGSLLYV